MKIYKFQLSLSESQTIRIQKGFKPLFVEVQNRVICLWAEINPNASTEDVIFNIVGTGHDYDPTDKTYMGSVLQDDYVWHIFKRKA